MATFSELLTIYINRAGITDSELARSIGVRRQTIFRWREGVVARPRHRDDVMRCADRLRLSPEERDTLLLAAGFAPETEQSLPASGQALEGEPSNARDLSSDPVDRSADSARDASNSAVPAVDASTSDTVVLHVDVSGVDDGPSSTESASNGPPVSEATKQKNGLLVAILAGLLVILVVIAVVALPDLLAGPGPAMTATPLSSTPIPSTAIPPATPIVSADGETLVLVSEFANYSPDQGFNVAGRLQEALADEIAAAELISTTAHVWPHVLSDPVDAQRVLGGSQAAMFDLGRVRQWACASSSEHGRFIDGVGEAVAFAGRTLDDHQSRGPA